MIPRRAASDRWEPALSTTSPTLSGPPVGRTAAGGIAVAAGTTAANVLSYGLSLAGARLLAPEQYGLFVALLAVTLVASVPALALQAVVAVRVVRAGGAAAGPWPRRSGSGWPRPARCWSSACWPPRCWTAS